MVYSITIRGFNLGIEMLFVSRSSIFSSAVETTRWFQSRNRDAFRFKSKMPKSTLYSRFLFQSRNRDAFRFKFALTVLACGEGRVDLMFQSRNRDAFRFKFNITFGTVRTVVLRVSISESRCFSFQVLNFLAGRVHIRRVSISESRCFSFQGP